MIKSLKGEQTTEDEEYAKCKQDLNDIELDIVEDTNAAANVAQVVEQKQAELQAILDEIKGVESVIAELDAVPFL